MKIDIGIATRTLPGQRESGDLSLVKRMGGSVLIAVVDGLGHGEEAASAAHAAVGVIERHAKESLPQLVTRCHAALSGTRGVVLNLALLEPKARRLTWLGVGNVCGVLARGDGAARPPRVSLVPLAGFVGAEPVLATARSVPLQRGDTLIFATDGVSTNFTDSLQTRTAPQAFADDILDRFATGRDDALVVVARYVGG
ncbi:MAG: SpoIIE family protein phosphatase [Gemmatimonadales bacterium]